MLNKARTNGTWSTWCGEEAWEGFLAYWASDEFKGKSARNKSNRVSSRGGAVHTTGRKAHIEVALDMTNYHDRLREVDSQMRDNSITIGSTKLQIWKYVVGGKTQARSTYVNQITSVFFHII